MCRRRIMKRIVTLTLNPSIDRSTRVDRVVAEDKLRCAPPRRDPGGGGVNVSRAIARLGGTSVAVYAAGGPTGEMLRVLLDRTGIDHRPVLIQEWTRENIHVEEDTTGRQYRFGMPGPALGTDEQQLCLDVVSDITPAPDYLVASGSLAQGVDEDFYAELARRERARGTRVIVDTSGAALCRAVEAGVYAIKPNMRELAALAGHPVDHESEQEAVCRRLIDQGRCEVVIASFGANGVLLVSADTCRRVRAPVVPIRSRVGAGDCTVAGFVLGLARGLDVVEAVLFGVAAGTAAVMSAGTELCRRADTETLYATLARDGAARPAPDAA
jgi:6-phosphofructokinase 2